MKPSEFIALSLIVGAIFVVVIWGMDAIVETMIKLERARMGLG